MKYLYAVSADGGETWAYQWLTQDKANVYLGFGYLVKKVRRYGDA